jgi:hypothetical protein
VRNISPSDPFSADAGQIGESDRRTVQDKRSIDRHVASPRRLRLRVAALMQRPLESQPGERFNYIFTPLGWPRFQTSTTRGW